jgi:hypothetical protein
MFYIWQETHDWSIINGFLMTTELYDIDEHQRSLFAIEFADYLDDNNGILMEA